MDTTLVKFQPIYLNLVAIIQNLKVLLTLLDSYKLFSSASPFSINQFNGLYISSELGLR